MDAERRPSRLSANALDVAKQLEDPHERELLREVGMKLARLAASADARRVGVAFKDRQRIRFTSMEEETRA